MANIFDRVKLVMGWDIGDGDTAAFARVVTGGSTKLVPLFIHKSRDVQVVKSAVAKSSNGTVTIGDEAAKQQRFIVNFKRSPKRWGKRSALKLEYRQHMFDYIRGVSEAILQNSSNRSILSNFITQDSQGKVRWNGDEIVLVVGCPASVIWKGRENREKYEKLISEATGIQHVVVTEESRAAVFSLFELEVLRKRVDLQKGVLVLDLGSSTSDATCILPGRMTINLSWELGAAKIEWAMLQYILNSKKAGDALSSLSKQYGFPLRVNRNGCSHAIFQLRKDKEDYFDGKLGEDTLAQALEVPVMNEDGDSILDEDGDPVQISVKYHVTAQMMEYAASEFEFEAKKDDIVVSTGSWQKNYANFLEDVRLNLQKNKIQVGSVVVTGGGSNMPFTVQIAKKVFTNVLESDAPSHSVVKGLATIAYNEVKAPGVRGDAIPKIVLAGVERANKTIENIASKLSEKAFDAVVSELEHHVLTEPDIVDRIIERIDFKCNVGDISRWVETAIQNSLSQNKDNVINSNLKSWTDADCADIVKIVNEAASTLYADKAIRDMVLLDQSSVVNISKRVSFGNNITIGGVGADANFIGAVLGVILSIIFIAVLAVIAAIVPGLGTFFTLLVGTLGGAIIIEEMKNMPGIPVSDDMLRKSIKKLKKKRSEKLSEISGPVRDEIRKAFTAQNAYGTDFSKYQSNLRETANRAFNRILLKTEND